MPKNKISNKYQHKKFLEEGLHFLYEKSVYHLMSIKTIINQ